MESKQIGGNIYFEAYLACPVCHERGTNTGSNHWVHYGCGGKMFLGDNANYHCEKCGQTNHVSKWKYGCPEHSTNNDYELDLQFGVATSICSLAHITLEAGVPWLQKFLQNYANQQ